jgi:hypothetical protein
MPPVRGDEDGVAGHDVLGVSNNFIGVRGCSDRGYGVNAYNDRYIGVIGRSYLSTGVAGYGDIFGVYGHGYSDSGYGVYGRSSNELGVYGYSVNSFGVQGFSPELAGIVGHSIRGDAVIGSCSYGHGVFGGAEKTSVWVATASMCSVYAISFNGLAAHLDGNVRLTGILQKAGGSFKIDHPLDPANKYLHHSFVESPDMKNVYDGAAVLHISRSLW